ncbi:MAG: glycosyltransferase family 4 protein [Verrucomicrobiota bacterium JB025]|nr:glycosyltransferase [Verrucomicrobiota bacterium JB025]
MRRILVSSIACLPEGGSEGAVGWNAVLAIAETHEVGVLTHRQNESAIEQARARGAIPSNVSFRYLGKDKQWHPNRLIARAQSWLRFTDYNKQVLAAALDWHKESPFDLVHQVTYATWRVPSQLWQMPIPFVWGPVGGSAVIPPAFLKRLGLKARLMESARALQTARTLRTKAFHDCIHNASVVIAANEETLEFLMPHRKGLPLIQLPVAYLSPQKVARFTRDRSTAARPRPLNIFAGGNIEARKGVDMALQALAGALRKNTEFRFHYTVAGGGPDVPRLRKLARELGIEEMVTFHPGFKGGDYIKILKKSDIYLLPSLRETLGMTLQEAVLAGAFPIVANTSAQGEITRMAQGDSVVADNPDTLVNGLSHALLTAFNHRDSTARRAENASRKVAEFFSEQRYKSILEEAYSTAWHQQQA